MNKIKAAKICCITLGTVLLLSALFLVLYNVLEDQKSGEKTAGVLQELKSEIPEYTTLLTTMATGEQYDLYETSESTTETVVPEMETAVVDGNAYIGFISIPELDVELPVLGNWSYPNLKIAPCLYQGNIVTDDMIICAHNYSTHFGRIKTLHTDSEIIFTEISGKETRYTVMNIEELPGTAVDEIRFGNADDWDLTLFTCTLSGQSRVTVRAVRTEN